LSGSAEELAEELRRAIVAAVARAIGDARKVAIALSGGLDSSGVLAAAVVLARGGGPKELHALTLDFADPGDDRPYVRALCDELGIVPVRVAPSSLGRWVRGALAIDGAPCIVPTASWVLDAMSRVREARADVLLTGDGGDFVFEGDLSAIAARAQGGEWLAAARSAMRLELPFVPRGPARVMDLVIRPMLRRRVPFALRARWRARALGRRFPWVTRAARAWAARALRDAMRTEVDPYGTRADASWLEAGGSARLLDYGDVRTQLEHAAGASWQSPYFDPELVDFVRRIPSDKLLHGGRSRGLYREAFRGLLPEGVRLRGTKSGVGEAVREIVRGSGGLEAFGDLLELRRLRALDLVDPSAVRASLDRAMRGGAANWTALWAPLAIEAFLERIAA
jgi:asparagine synthase (glutamine-hydrolysing)